MPSYLEMLAAKNKFSNDKLHDVTTYDCLQKYFAMSIMSVLKLLS